MKSRWSMCRKEKIRIPNGVTLIDRTVTLGCRKVIASVEHTLLEMKVGGYRKGAHQSPLGLSRQGPSGAYSALCCTGGGDLVAGGDRSEYSAASMSQRTLSPCPSSPNCVSTQATDESHAIAPFPYKKSRVEAKEALKAVLATLSRIKLVEEDESYLHYEFTSLLLRFVDGRGSFSSMKPRRRFTSVLLPARATAILVSTANAWSRCAEPWWADSFKHFPIASA